MTNIDRNVYLNSHFILASSFFNKEREKLSAINLLRKGGYIKKHVAITGAVSQDLIKHLKIVLLKAVLYQVYTKDNNPFLACLSQEKQLEDLPPVNYKFTLEEAQEDDDINYNLENTDIIYSKPNPDASSITKPQQCLLFEDSKSQDSCKNVEKEFLFASLFEPATSLKEKHELDNIEETTLVECDSTFKTPEKICINKILPILNVKQINQLDSNEISLIPASTINRLAYKDAHFLGKHVIKKLPRETIEGIDLDLISEFSNETLMELRKRIIAFDPCKYKRLARSILEVADSKNCVSPFKLPKGVTIANFNDPRRKLIF